MFKKALLKAVVGTAVVAGVAVVPAVTASPALAGYETGTSTTTSATGNPPAAYYGTQPTVTATVAPTGTSAGSPSGKVTFTVKTGANYQTTFASSEVNLTATAGNKATATYTFPATTPGDASYQVQAAYTPSGTTYNSSISTPTYVTIYKYATTIQSVSKSASSWTVKITAPDRAPNASGESLTDGQHSVTFYIVNNGGNLTGKTVSISANGQATYTLGKNESFGTAGSTRSHVDFTATPGYTASTLLY